ncbi:MAG: NAD-dependent epimerase/dehydratase family protein [Polyangiales bacterium]
MARVHLTGATGFVGGGTLEALLAEGHAVQALVRSPTFSRAGVDIVRGDLSQTRSLEGFDAVVHLAAAVDPALHRDDAEVRRNVATATIELADRARRDGVRTFVFTSSIAAVGFRDEVVTADSARRPVTAYGRAKAEAEEALLARASTTFHPVILRPPTIFGPGERYNFLQWVRAVSRGLFRTIGGGSNVFPLVSSHNVARAIVGSVAGRVPSGVHPLADPERYSMRRIHHAIAAALGVRAPRFSIPRPLADLVAIANDALAPYGVPSVLGRARVRTLTVDQPFDVSSLLAAGVPLRAELERDVAETVADQRRRGLV